MQEHLRTYIAIDLKSFYASVECVERGLDPLTTNLVVADVSRTEKTICLAVSPSLKAYGIGGRARLFEVVQRVREINNERKRQAGWRMTGKSYNDPELKANPSLELDYIAAPPQIWLKRIMPNFYQIRKKRVYKQKMGRRRNPVNLKSNTMKNTLQIYNYFVKKQVF